MGAYIWPVDAVAGSPNYTGRALRVAGGALSGGNSARPVGGISGVNPGTPSSIVAASSSTWTVQPHKGVIDGETAAAAGCYMYGFDTAQTGSMTAANATNPRIDIIYVQISDPAESDGSSVPGVAVVYLAGTAAPSPTIPTIPTSPARGFVLAQVNVPISGGGSPSVTWVAPYTAAAGGVQPVASSTVYPASPYDGQPIYDKALDTVFVYNGASWRPYLAACALVVQRDATISVATGGTGTNVGSFNLGVAYQSGTEMSYSSGVITIATGQPSRMYLFNPTVNWTGPSATYKVLQQPTINGTPTPTSGGGGERVSVSQSGYVTTMGAVILGGGDTIGLNLFQNSGVTMTPTPTQLALVRVG